MSDHTPTTALGKLLTIREPKLDYARRFKPGDTLAGVVMPLVAEIDAQRRQVAALTEDRERIEKALDRARATMIRAMDALESDAELDARREAFEMIQEQFEGVSTEDAARAEALIPQLREALDAARREETQG